MSKDVKKPHMFSPVKPWVTLGVITINIIIFMMMMESSVSGKEPSSSLWMQWGAMQPLKVWYGEIWRLVSAIFLHGNLLHLLLNCVVFFQVGRLLEPVLGHGRFAFTFLITGIVGFAASLLFNTSMAVGSSGAVFGVVGALIGLFLVFPKEILEKKLLQALLWFVGINFLLGLMINFGLESAILIDNAAHMGGLVTGFLLGIAFGVDMPWPKTAKAKNKKLIVGGNLALVTCYLVLFASVGLAIRPFYSINYYYQMGLFHVLQGEVDEASAFAGQLAEKWPADVRSNLLQGRIAAKQGNDSLAKKHFHEATNDEMSLRETWEINFRNPYQGEDFATLLFVDEHANKLLCKQMISKDTNAIGPDMLNDCAWLLLMASDSSVKDKALALSLVKKATQSLQKMRPEILHTLAEAYAQNGQLDEAVSAIDRAILQDPKKANYFKNEKVRFKKIAQKLN